MNNILNKVEELKELIIDTDEYKNYKFYLSKIEKNDDIKNLINTITKKQKELVRIENNGSNIDNESKELDNLFDKLYEYDDYKNYIEYSKKLNIIITDVQNNFQEYFDSLVS